MKPIQVSIKKPTDKTPVLKEGLPVSIHVRAYEGLDGALKFQAKGVGEAFESVPPSTLAVFEVVMTQHSRRDGKTYLKAVPSELADLEKTLHIPAGKLAHSFYGFYTKDCTVIAKDVQTAMAGGAKPRKGRK